MIHWKDKVRVSGTDTTLEGWLAELSQLYSDRQIAAIFTDAGFKTGREAVRAKRQTMGIAKAEGRRSWSTNPASFTVEASQDVPTVTVEVTPPGVPASLGKKAGVDVKDLLAAIRDKPTSLRDLSRRLDRSEETVRVLLEDLKAKHYNILEIDGKPELNTKAVARPKVVLPETLADQDGMTVRMLLISDLHTGSSAQQITNLRRFLRDGREMGIKNVLISGDLAAGHNVYQGQVHDLWAVGADAQLKVLCWTLPEDWFTYYVIGGNHDYSFIKSSGYNILQALAAARSDVVYLGFDMADVPITDRVDARMWHPSGGVPYAASYRLQKGMEAMAYEELTVAIQAGDNPKMRVVQAGHLHISIAMFRGPILGLQSGCFEGQTNYLKRKALFPQIGGYVLTLKLTDSGLIQTATPEFRPFLEVQDDYQNYPDALDLVRSEPEEKTVSPLFSWEAEGEEA